jgi:hypothetical protein
MLNSGRRYEFWSELNLLALVKHLMPDRFNLLKHHLILFQFKLHRKINTILTLELEIGIN